MAARAPGVRAVAPGALLLAAVGACLEEGPRPEGRQVAEGRDLGNLVLGWAGAPVMLFDRGGPSADRDFEIPRSTWMLDLDDARPPKVLPRVPSPGTAVTFLDSRQLIFLHGTISGPPLPLARVAIDGGELIEEAPAATGHGRWGATFFTVRFRAGTTAPSLFVWDTRIGGYRDYGAVRRVRVGDAGGLFLVRVQDGTLLHAEKPERALEVLRQGVLDFHISAGERHVLMEGPLVGEYWALNLGTRLTRKLPVPTSCRALGIVPGRAHFACLEAMSGAAAAMPDHWRLHVLALDGARDAVLDLPLSPPALPTVFWRPGTEDGVAGIAPGTFALFQPRATPPVRPLAMGATFAAFTPDGRSFLYIGSEEDAAPGRLVAWDADFARAPRAVSPPRLVVGDAYFLEDAAAEVLFRAGPRNAAPDLFALDLGTDSARRLATGVSELRAAGRRVLAITDVRGAGGPGHLRLHDLDAGTGHELARGVSAFAALGACPACAPLDPGAHVAAVVRGPSGRDPDGLWLLRLP